MNYNHDMLHCSQHTCNKRGTCYRYWLGQEVKNRDYLYTSFYQPEEPVTDGCEYYFKIH